MLGKLITIYSLIGVGTAFVSYKLIKSDRNRGLIVVHSRSDLPVSMVSGLVWPYTWYVIIRHIRINAH